MLLDVLAILCVAVFAKLLHPLLLAGLPLPLFTLICAMTMGAALRRFAQKAWDPPIDLPLAVGMTLLGVQFEARHLEVFGLRDLAFLLVHWLVVALSFAGIARLRFVEARSAGLFAVGLSGCGISAILAAADADKKLRSEQRSAAVGLVLMAGSLGFLAIPFFADAFELSARELALWAGVGLPTSSEAVLVGSGHSAAAMQLVGVYRFAVNVLQWIPILIYVRIFARQAKARSPRELLGGSLSCVPAFVWGLSFFGTFGFCGSFDEGERRTLAAITSWSFLTCVAAIGVRLRVASIFALGPRTTLIGLAAWGAAVALLPLWAFRLCRAL